jgi:hypothetical protein
MKLEYFSEGSNDCPLILIYGQDPVGTLNLRLAFERLAVGLTDEIAVHEIPGYASIDGCKLFSRIGWSDIGIERQGKERIFICTLQKDSWLNIVGLLEPFAESVESSDNNYHQYLDETSEIRLLISTHRGW